MRESFATRVFELPDLSPAGLEVGDSYVQKQKCQR